MKKVQIYTTPTCVYCRQTKELFKSNNIQYEEYNAAADAERREEMINKTGQLGVPVTVVSEMDGSQAEVVIGFDEPRLRAALGL